VNGSRSTTTLPLEVFTQTFKTKTKTKTRTTSLISSIARWKVRREGRKGLMEDRELDEEVAKWGTKFMINVKTEFIYKCYRLTHRKQLKLELSI